MAKKDNKGILLTLAGIAVVGLIISNNNSKNNSNSVSGVSNSTKAKRIEDDFKNKNPKSLNDLYTIIQSYGFGKMGMVPDWDTTHNPWRLKGMFFWDSKNVEYRASIPNTLKITFKL